jgi:alpha-tubulin suppressor-like RCC1 family protein
VVRGFLVLTLVGGCGRIAFDDLADATTNGDGVIQRGCVAELAAYGDTICVRRTDGHVWCWGQGDQGALGDGSLVLRDVPGPSQMVDAIALSSGEDTVCAIRADRSVACWGAGDLGQIGDGGGTDVRVPSQVSLPAPVAEIDVGQYHACARLTDGQGFCWGYNAEGALGVPISGNHNSPVAAPIGAAKQVAIGDEVTCMIRQDDTLVCFGRNDEGDLGDGMVMLARPTPMPVVGIPEAVTQVAGGCHRHSCAVGASGAVYCWGANMSGEIGTGSTSSYETPARTVTGIPPAKKVSVGTNHSCILSRSGEIWCWGRNLVGELGIGTTTSSLVPMRVTGFTGTAADIQASCANTHVLRDDGTLVGWGLAPSVGTGQSTDALSPVEVDIPCN